MTGCGMSKQFRIEPLENVVDRLAAGYSRYLGDKADAQIRDGLIYRLKPACDAAHKALKRYFDSESANLVMLDRMTFAAIIRTAN